MEPELSVETQNKDGTAPTDAPSIPQLRVQW
jgi:hypothetical protein